MTKEEFLSSQDSIQKEIEKLSVLQSDKRKELDQLHNDWCNELCKQYADYIGKRVKIVFKHDDVEGTKVVDGFLIGFSYTKGWRANGIMPDVAKVNKGGTQSKVLFSVWDVCYWDEIVSIEKI